jgi:transposase-like protein
VTSVVYELLSTSWVAGDEKQIERDNEMKWLYVAIDTDSTLFLEVDVYGRCRTGPASAFLHLLSKKYDVVDTEFLVETGGYLPEKWF